MTRMGSWLALVGSLLLLWQECNENPVVFCYRMVWSLLAGQKVATPKSHGSNDEAACSSHSNNYFTLSMTSKG